MEADVFRQEELEHTPLIDRIVPGEFLFMYCRSRLPMDFHFFYQPIIGSERPVEEGKVHTVLEMRCLAHVTWRGMHKLALCLFVSSFLLVVSP